MYLNLLNYDDKKLFFALANRLVRIDGKITDSEIELLEAYRTEMNLISTETMLEIELEDILDSITEDPIIRKIIIFELVSLAFIDLDISDYELSYLESIIKKWNISEDSFYKIQELAKNLINVSNQISSFILLNE